MICWKYLFFLIPEMYILLLRLLTSYVTRPSCQLPSRSTDHALRPGAGFRNGTFEMVPSRILWWNDLLPLKFVARPVAWRPSPSTAGSTFSRQRLVPKACQGLLPVSRRTARNTVWTLDARQHFFFLYESHTFHKHNKISWDLFYNLYKPLQNC